MLRLFIQAVQGDPREPFCLLSPVLPIWCLGVGLGSEDLTHWWTEAQAVQCTSPTRQPRREHLPTPSRTHRIRAPGSPRSGPQYSPRRGSQRQVLAEGISPASQGEGSEIWGGLCPPAQGYAPAPKQCSVLGVLGERRNQPAVGTLSPFAVSPGGAQVSLTPLCPGFCPPPP